MDVVRSELASEALAEGFDELMWIDADLAFDPAAIDKLRSHRLPIVCGIYPKKGMRELACNLLPETKRVDFGKIGGLMELRYAGAGFLLTHRIVYERTATESKLPTCNAQFGAPFVPYFMPLMKETDQGTWYLGEDYAFCERARQSGFRIMSDTTVRLYHLGSYRFGWEDAGRDVARYEDYQFHLRS